MRRFLLLLSLLVFGFSLDLFSQEPIGNDSLTISLDEVSIIAHNEFVQSNLNGFLVTIAGNIETKGRETTDILKQIPMLTISGDILGMSGKSTVIVYIDDRIVRLEGSTLLSYLNSLPPDIIKTIEVETTPSVKYDSSDNVGIVKIVTKRNIFPGWKGNLRLGYLKNSYSSFIASSFVNYTGSKFHAGISCFYSDFNELNISHYASYFPNETMEVYNPKKWMTKECMLNSILGYDFSENTSITLDFQVPLKGKSIIDDLENTTQFFNIAGHQSDSIISSKGNTLSENNVFNVGLLLKHAFGDDLHFSFNTNYLFNNMENIRGMESKTWYSSDENLVELFYTNSNMNRNILTSQVDFSFPLFYCDASAGYKFSYINTTSNDSMTHPIVNHNRFHYLEQIHALYYSMEKNIENWSFSVGLRGELTMYNGHSINDDRKFGNTYFKLFPTFCISHQINDNNRLAINYSERIERPPFQYLDPFKWYVSKYDYAVGNPLLKPSYIKNLEMRFLHGETFSSSIYYSRQDGKIGQMVVLDSTDIMNQVQKPDNFLDVNAIGVNLYKMARVANWYSVVLQGDFSFVKFKSNRNEFTDLSGFNGTLTASNTFIIGDGIQIYCDLEERLPGLYDYRNTANFFNLSLGASYTTKNDRLQVKIHVNDLLKTANPSYSYISGGVNQCYWNYTDTRFLRVMLIWNFGNQYNRNNEATSTNDDERKRL